MGGDSSGRKNQNYFMYDLPAYHQHQVWAGSLVVMK